MRGEELQVLLPKCFAKYACASGRGTAEAISKVMSHQALTAMLGRRSELSIYDCKQGLSATSLAGGFQICLDINKAFDRVSRATMLRSAAKHGVRADALSLLSGWHATTPYMSIDVVYLVTLASDKA